MSAHTCTTLIDGCYRCDLNRDEIRAIEEEIRRDAQTAWLKYRDDYTRTNYLSPRTVAHRMRRRDFIAGYLSANDMQAVG